MIEARNIAFTYNHAPFIEGFSHVFDTGSIATIVGPNGCGKSTVVKLLTRHLKPQAGAVLLDGENSEHFGTRALARKVALLAQNTHVPNMEVEQLVQCGRFPHQTFAAPVSREDTRIVSEALEMTGAKPFRHKNVKNLSGGERQKVFLAMALAQDADIIVLDEPTAYLDIHACYDVMQLVCRLNEQLGKTIIMVLHDLQLALEYSHEIVVMQGGSILASGNSEEVIASHAIEDAFRISLRRFWEDGHPYYSFSTQATAHK
ncbi:MAG: ABC transporter ATP-binding protein [Coriobacteriales bacterium]|jgi:iron complex transport system ATP-binding protein|nr:ABC transporter ATP-binding protein [Coriobacteriales bacterium]